MQVPFLDLQAAYTELREELDSAYAAVMNSGVFVQGPQLFEFEQEFAAYCQTKHAIGVGNGLDALRLILQGYGIGVGDEVIVPGNTFIATWLAVSHVGATPVPVDVLPGSGNIDPKAVSEAISERTRAVVAVHLYGNPADMSALSHILNGTGIKLIEDAAQAHGACYSKQRTGGLADAAAFSFYPAKNLGAFGDGGVVVTGDEQLASKIHRLRNYGSASKYVHVDAGVNSRLDELQAAFLRVKLRYLDVWNERRSRIAEYYNRELDGEEALTLLEPTRGSEPVWHLFPVRYEERDRMQSRLMEMGVTTSVHYPVLPHRSEVYQEQYAKHILPVTERIAKTVLSLPIGPHLNDEQAERVVTAIKKVI